MHGQNHIKQKTLYIFLILGTKEDS
jgi:hypothetical protein